MSKNDSLTFGRTMHKGNTILSDAVRQLIAGEQTVLPGRAFIDPIREHLRQYFELSGDEINKRLIIKELPEGHTLAGWFAMKMRREDTP